MNLLNNSYIGLIELISEIPYILINLNDLSANLPNLYTLHSLLYSYFTSIELITRNMCLIKTSDDKNKVGSKIRRDIRDNVFKNIIKDSFMAIGRCKTSISYSFNLLFIN